MERDQLIQVFLDKNELGTAVLVPLRQDASTRRYFRLRADSRDMILMDAPPETENPAAFIRATEYLSALGARVPALLVTDPENGLLVIEDLGDQTFTKLLDAGACEQSLYRHAVDELAAMQQHFPALSETIDLPHYDFEAVMAEARLFTDWYLPARIGRTMSAREDRQFREIWLDLFDQRPPLQAVMVHRDYHVDNLVMVADRCAMLDYQDALLGSPLYDLLSLLEDARRDVSPSLRTSFLDEWRQQSPLDAADFDREYRFWGAQRHCKVAGIFVRLWKRDGKNTYLRHLERVMNLLAANLKDPSLHTLEAWISDRIGPIAHAPLDTQK